MVSDQVKKTNTLGYVGEDVESILTRLDPTSNTFLYEFTLKFTPLGNPLTSTFEPKTFSATNLISGRYKVEVWKNEDPWLLA